LDEKKKNIVVQFSGKKSSLRLAPWITEQPWYTAFNF